MPKKWLIQLFLRQIKGHAHDESEGQEDHGESLGKGRKDKSSLLKSQPRIVPSFLP